MTAEQLHLALKCSHKNNPLDCLICRQESLIKFAKAGEPKKPIDRLWVNFVLDDQKEYGEANR